MTSSATPARTAAAVLFADVSGSTRLYEVAGDAVGAATIAQCIALLKHTTQSAGGRVMRTVGDEILALFPSADAAARAAMEMQSGFAQLAPAAGIRIGARIGFNYGQVMERDGELYGDAVNVAARLAALAQKDQIITSAETLEALSPALKASCRRLYAVPVKGKEQEIELCQVVWQQSEDSTFLVSAQAAPVPRNAALRLRYRAAEIVLDAAHGSLALGRDRSSGLVVEDAKASRAHCKIERRGQKFMLADHSANGTYVTIEGEPEVLIRRDELALRGRGWIAFGQPRSAAAEPVEFSCED